MVAVTTRLQTTASVKRLTLQTVEIASETTAMRSLDWDRDRFDIEFSLQNGTTYNSFLIRGEKIALVDTSHRKFETLYRDTLMQLIDPTQIDYLIISHTEPDHSGLVADILELAPNITIVAAKVAIQFLENMVHRPFKSIQVKNGERLDLGNGHELTFFAAPNLHWPDTIFTYDAKSKLLFTCDAFGMHYCDDHIFDENPKLLEADFKYYYDCLMGPNARSVLSALKRIEGLDIDMIATGHGPLLKNHIAHWTQNYRVWSEEQAKTETLVALFYTEDYGYSAAIATEIAEGITRTGVIVEKIDLNSTELQDVRELVIEAKGIVIGMPPQSNITAQAALKTIIAATHPKQIIGLFESGGGEDEPLFPLRIQLLSNGLTEAFSPILIKEPPTLAFSQRCHEAGTDLGQELTRERTLKQIKSINPDLEKALGRISSGLYILTAQKESITSAMLASWVTQASLSPLGVAIAVAKERAMIDFLQIGDHFVLNVLSEGNYQNLMKHFLKRFAPGDNRFAGIKTYQANNNAPILAEALAYLECEVTSRLDCHDHWIIYSTVETGRVANINALTAVLHRKVGNHY